MEKKEIMAGFRTRIEAEKATQTARMQTKLAPLREEISEHAWSAFIEPLLFVDYEKGVVIIFSEDKQWVEDHYLVAIERALGVRVRVVDQMEMT